MLIANSNVFPPNRRCSVIFQGICILNGGSRGITYANVCTLSLFLTCRPYVRLPGWAGENSPECFILVNKQHQHTCQVPHAPCQSLAPPLPPLPPLIRYRTSSVAANVAAFPRFSRLCGCQLQPVTLQRQHTQRTPELHSGTWTHRRHTCMEAKYWQDQKVKCWKWK